MNRFFLKKILSTARYLFHYLFSRFYHLGRKVGFAKGVIIEGAKYIELDDHVGLSQNVQLCVMENLGYDSIRPRLILGKRVGIGYASIFYCLNSIRIGKDVMLGPQCFVCDYNHSHADTTKPIALQPLCDVAPVVIEQGAWLGAQVTVCPGVTIGKNAVIGANSVVTKDIPDYAVAAGIPAKVIKKYNPDTKKWDKV